MNLLRFAVGKRYGTLIGNHRLSYTV